MANKQFANMDIKVVEVYPGKIVEGIVDSVEPKTARLNLHTYAEGVIHLEYYTNDKDIKSLCDVLKVGDVVTAKIEKIDEENGIILLNRKPLLGEEVLSKIIELKDSKERIMALVKEENKGGLVLDYNGSRLFLPNPLLDRDLLNNKKDLIGKELEVIITEVEGKTLRNSRIIATRKPIFQERRKQMLQDLHENREKALAEINEGDKLNVKVVKINPHSVEVSINEFLNGQIRISQVCHHNIDKITDVIQLEQELEVLVLKKEGRRIDLSLKALAPTPFEQYASEHKVGDVVVGKINKKVEFGFFIELARGVRGLLHKSEISWNPRNNFEAEFNIDDEVKVQITKIDKAEERISLSRKSLEDNPWANFNFKVGQKVEVEVTEVLEDQSGLKAKLGTVEGFISQYELINRDSLVEKYPVGTKLNVVISKVNRNTWELEFSEKKLVINKQKSEIKKLIEDQNEDEKITLGDLFEL